MVVTGKNAENHILSKKGGKKWWTNICSGCNINMWQTNEFEKIATIPVKHCERPANVMTNVKFF